MEKSYGWGGRVCGLLDYSASPSPSHFPLDFGFRIWDLNLGLAFGTGLGLDNWQSFSQSELPSLSSSDVTFILFVSGGSTLLTEVSIKTAQFTDIVSLLLDAGADLDIVDSLGNTPLHNAVLYWPSTQQTVDLLLARGADVTLKNNEGSTPFHMAEDKELKHVLMELKKKKTQRLLSKRTRSKQKGYKDSPNLRKLVCDQGKPGKSAKVIVKFNGKVQTNKPGLLKRKRSKDETEGSEDENGERSNKRIRFNNIVDSSEGVLKESLNNSEDMDESVSGKNKIKKSKKVVSGILNNVVNSMFKKKRT